MEEYSKEVENTEEVETTEQSQEGSNSEEQGLNHIDPNLYKKTQSDMMKYKNQKRELEAELQRLQEEAKQREQNELANRQEWEKLAKLREQELNSIKQQRQKEQTQMIESHKKAAVIQSVGGFLKPEYADFAIKLDNIAMVDGIIDQGTLDAEVARIRKEESALLKRSATPNLPQGAPDSSVKATGKSYNDMTAAEKLDYRRKLLENK